MNLKIDLQSILASNKVQSEFTQLRITFKTIPKASPWMGGFYERLIGLSKRVLRKIFNKRSLTYVELLTCVKEAQAVINDRNLTHVSSDPLDLSPICPNQLIIGKRVATVPYYDSAIDNDPNWNTADKVCLLQKNQRATLTEFKNRFVSEYLTALQERHKYDRKDAKTFREVVRKGLVCQILSENKGQRKLAVIENLHRGSDGIVRSVTLRTANGTTSRPITKLFPLGLGRSGKC